MTPLHRERICTSCDIGRARSELQQPEQFPNYDFDECNVAERWWEDDGQPNPSFAANDVGKVLQEDQQAFANRVTQFRSWLQARPETAIVVVGHSNFFRHFLGASSKLKNCEVKKVLL